MPIVRIAPVCNGKIYVAPRMASDGESLRLDLPIEESGEHISTKSEKTARKIKEKYQAHIRTDASPRFCVQYKSKPDWKARNHSPYPSSLRVYRPSTN